MNPGRLFLVGITHRTAPLGLRERFSLSGEVEAEFAQELFSIPGVTELVVLATCNRVEIYAVGADNVQPQIAALFCARQRVALEEFNAVCLNLSDRPVVEHLLAVASGLDSQMVGETEIFGQVKKAYLRAQERAFAGPVLNRIFQKAFQAAKEVRSRTAITAGLVSVASVTVDLAQKVFGRLAGAQVLLLGAGDIGQKSGRAFRSRGAGALSVASRTSTRAAAVATELAATAIPFPEAIRELAKFDVIVCSTSAPGTILSRAMLEAAMAQRGGRPVFVIDVALPRDVEAEVAQIPGVFLYDLDDLARIAAENRTARQSEITKCHAILEHRSSGVWEQARRQLDDLARTGPAVDSATRPESARPQPAGREGSLIFAGLPAGCAG